MQDPKKWRRMGTAQLMVLRWLVAEQRGWHRNCGWSHYNNFATERALEGLYRRGFVEPKFGSFFITDEGRQALNNSEN